MTQAIRQIIIPDNLVFPEKDRGVELDCSHLATDGVVFIGDDGDTMWVEKEPFTGRITDYDFTEAEALWAQADDMLNNPETEPPSADDLAAMARAQRDALLTACDWVAVRAIELGEPVPQDWANYRQALRDVPQQSGFPENIDWPVPPLEDPNDTQ